MSTNNIGLVESKFSKNNNEEIKSPTKSESSKQSQNLKVNEERNNNALEDGNNNNNKIYNNAYKKTLTNSIFTVRSNDCLSNTTSQIKSNKENKEPDDQMKSNAELQVDMKDSNVELQIKESAGFGKPDILLPEPLQELNSAISCRIEQIPEIAGANKSCELVNKFLVYITTNSGVENKLKFICREVTNFCTKSCCSDCSRPFNLEINYVIKNKETDEDNENIYEQPFGFAKKECNCSCFCLNREVLKVKLKDVECKLGKVIDVFTCGSPRFEILDEDGVCKYTLHLGCCQCGFLCCNCNDVELNIYAFKDFTQQVGYCTKILACCDRVPCEKNWIMKFPEAATPQDKFLMIMCVINIDYRYFELNGAYYRAKMKDKKTHKKK